MRPDGNPALLGGTVPIVIDGTMYLPLGSAVVALEAHTGRELWRHQVQGGVVRRGVTWWPGDGTLGPRLFYNNGARITALDPATGQVDAAFGEAGSIAIDGTPYGYPPTIYKNVMVIGATTAEMPRGPSGNSRAYDARTGKKLWEFNTVPQPGEVGHDSWIGDGWKQRSGTNMWIWYTTADPSDRHDLHDDRRSLAQLLRWRPAGEQPVRQLDRRGRRRDRQVQVALPDDPPRLVGLGPARPAGAVRRDESTARRSPRWPKPASRG